MSRSGAPTVAQLKEKLRDYGLPVAGRKAELEARIAAYQAEQVKQLSERPPEMAVAGPSFQQMPRNVITKISKYALNDLFYFSDKAELMYKIKEPIQIFPATLEWTVNNAQNVQSVRRANVTSKEDGTQHMATILATPGLKSIIMKRDHLTVRVVFNISRIEIQVLLFYPGIQDYAYQLRMHGTVPYNPNVSNKKTYLLDYATASRNFNSRWTAAQCSIEDARKAIKDLMLGVQWFKTFVLKAQWNPLTLDNYKDFLPSRDLAAPDTLKSKDMAELKKFYIKQLNKILSKSRQRGI